MTDIDFQAGRTYHPQLIIGQELPDLSGRAAAGGIPSRIETRLYFVRNKAAGNLDSG